MLTITPLATEKVREVLGNSEQPSAYALRIFVRGMSCSGPAYGMALDNEPNPEDLVETLGDIRVLIDPSSVEYLQGAEIDYVEGLTGKGFTIQNPTLQTSGGCGSGCSCGANH